MCVCVDLQENAMFLYMHLYMLVQYINGKVKLQTFDLPFNVFSGCCRILDSNQMHLAHINQCHVGHNVLIATPGGSNASMKGGMLK